MLSDWSVWTRSAVVLPFCRTNGMAIWKAPPNEDDAALWNHAAALEVRSIVRLVVEKFDSSEESVGEFWLGQLAK